MPCLTALPRAAHLEGCGARQIETPQRAVALLPDSAQRVVAKSDQGHRLRAVTAGNTGRQLSEVLPEVAQCEAAHASMQVAMRTAVTSDGFCTGQRMHCSLCTCARLPVAAADLTAPA